MFLTVVSFIVVLGILVFIHELGHYWVARRNGIVVEEFGFGYPPRLIRLFRYDGTDFTLNLLPFGGFARMKGEDAGDMSPGSFNAASLGGRAATLAAGPAMNALLAILLFAASFLAGFPSAAGYPSLTVVEPGSPAAQIGLQAGDVLLTYQDNPLQVSLDPEASIRAEPISQAGPAVLVLSRNEQLVRIPIEDASVVQDILSQTEFLPVLMTEITGVAVNSPAEASGMQAGDLVYAVNDSVVTLDNSLNALVQEHLDEPITVTMLRGEQWTRTSITPRADPPPGEGAMGVQIGPVTEMATLGLWPSLREGMRSTLDYALLVLQLPVLLILGQVTPEQATVSGPVGIAQMVGGAVSATLDTGLWFPILRLSAVLSAALAITNLLPLPALDGGRLIFILIEMLRGRRVSPEREGLIHMVGFMLLIGLLIIITVRDLSATPQGIDWISLMGQ